MQSKMSIAEKFVQVCIIKCQLHKFFEEKNTLGTRYLVHSKIGTHLVAGQARKQHKHTHNNGECLL